MTKDGQKLLQKTKTFCYPLPLFDLKKKYANCKTKKRISEHFCSNLIDALTTPSSAGKFGAEIRLNIEFIIDVPLYQKLVAGQPLVKTCKWKAYFQMRLCANITSQTKQGCFYTVAALEQPCHV